MTSSAPELAARLAEWISRDPARSPCWVVGLAGPQGSGKSTLAWAIVQALSRRRLSSVVLSLDDLYLTRAERLSLAGSVHSQYAVRGPPGTHDIGLGEKLLGGLCAGESLTFPCFDKAQDDRAGDGAVWAGGAPDVVLFEGWCVGARPEPVERLAAPLNAFERSSDADGAWRRRVNDALSGPYARLFARLHRLILLQPPSFDVVPRWRAEQERALAKLPSGQPRPGLMTEQEIGAFIERFERVSRRLIERGPEWADIVVQLDELRRPLDIVERRQR